MITVLKESNDVTQPTAGGTAPIVDRKSIEQLYEDSEKIVETHFDKLTVVILKLPNGFTLVEYSGCVSPENYDQDKGEEICKERLISKLWELEGYLLQNSLN